MSQELAVKGPKDWHSSKHIAKRALYLLEHPDEEIPCDVTFLVGDGRNEAQKTFKCHKFILAMVSSMFQAMFFGSFPQTEDIINIPDVTPAAFQHMLRYAYGDCIDLDKGCPEGALDVLYCANKYLIDKLSQACRDHLQFDIMLCKEEHCAVFQRASQIGEESLAALALTRIALFAETVMKGDSFLRLSVDCMKRLLDCPHLAAKETSIYQNVRRWVEHNVGAVTGSAVRDTLGSLLYSIRFPLFSATELAEGPVTDDVLTSDEARNIFQFLLAKVKPELPFLTTPRTSLPSPLWYPFDLVTASGPSPILNGLVGPFLRVYPDLAPECCAFFQQLVASKSHIRIASFDNEHAGKTVPLPAAVPQERNVLAHSIKGACWFEWDVVGDTASNIRIGLGRKPHTHHSAVFGFLLGLSLSGESTPVPFHSLDNQLIRGVVNFRVY